MSQEVINVSLVDNRHLVIDTSVNDKNWNTEFLHFTDNEEAVIYLSEFLSMYSNYNIQEQPGDLYVITTTN